ncbi:nucleosome assembly protein 1;2-like [Drosophila obscura]|uniref:nucleosome assembly protein 1;2-like n=1 Tax=Drosophila obscura TaxID=7282 RepID=UPI000BA041C0|nr:nucleosome assembly protein 1;2-like [Drosophila obscura]
MDAQPSERPQVARVAANTVPAAVKVEEQNLDTYTAEESKVVEELREVFMDTIELDIQMQRDIYHLEMKYQLKYQELFDQRKKLLDAIRKQYQPHGQVTSQLQIFWLLVLKSSYANFINDKDEQILMYLNNVSARMFSEPARFEIYFHFDKNPYFSNDVLSKTYYLKCEPDAESPLLYEGAEIVKSKGCYIDWTDGPCSSNEEEANSFFDLFNPPQLPESMDDPTYAEVYATLQSDFQMGFYIKERVIPKAIIFFTREIHDCQTPISTSDLDSDDDDDDGDDDLGDDLGAASEESSAIDDGEEEEEEDKSAGTDN